MTESGMINDPVISLNLQMRDTIETSEFSRTKREIITIIKGILIQIKCSITNSLDQISKNKISFQAICFVKCEVTNRYYGVSNC